MNHPNLIETKEITTLILAGGRGRRMGGRDKGLLPIGDKPAIEHVMARIQPQAAQIIISANRNLQQYKQYGCPVVVDSMSGFPGPLAGILAGLEACNTTYLLTVPVDTPLIDPGFTERMKNCMEQSAAPACVAECANQLEPLFCLLRRSLKDPLEHYLERGERSVRGWIQQVGAKSVDCSDIPDQFINLNDTDDLREFGTRFS